MARSQRRIVLRGVGYAGACYVVVLLVAAGIGDTQAGGDTYLDLAVPALALTILAPITALVGALVGLWPYRHIRLKGEDRIRHRLATAVVLTGAGATFLIDHAISSISVLIIGITALVIMKLALLNRGVRRHRYSI